MARPGSLLGPGGAGNAHLGVRSSPNPTLSLSGSSPSLALPPAGSSSPFLSFLATNPAGSLPAFPTSPGLASLGNVLADLGGAVGTAPAAMAGTDGQANGTAGPQAPAVQTDDQVVSCVFVIEATLRGRQAWKAFGETYLRSIIAKVQTTYPRAAAVRLLPVLITSLPPAAPAHLTLQQPLPFSSVPTLLAALPTLMDPLESAGVGGDDPAFLDGLVRGLELLERPLPPSLTVTPVKHRKHLIMLATTDLTPADLPFFGPANTPMEAWSGILPMFAQTEEYDEVGWAELFNPLFANPGDERKGVLEQKEVRFGMVIMGSCPRLVWLLRRALNVPATAPNPSTSDGLKLLKTSHVSLLSGLDTISFSSPSAPSQQPTSAVPAKRPSGPAGSRVGTPGQNHVTSSPLTNVSSLGGPPAKKARFAEGPPQQHQPQNAPTSAAVSSAASTLTATTTTSDSMNRPQLGSFPTLAASVSAPSQNSDDSLSAALAALERANPGAPFLTSSSQPPQPVQPPPPAGPIGHGRQPSNASSATSSALPNISSHATDTSSTPLPPSIPQLYQTAETVALLERTSPPQQMGGIRNLFRLGVNEKVPTPQEVVGWTENTRDKGNAALKDIHGKLERGEMNQAEVDTQLMKLKSVVAGRVQKFNEMRILVGKLWKDHLSRSNIPINNLIQPQAAQGAGMQQQQQQRPPAVTAPNPGQMQLNAAQNGAKILWKGMLQWRLPTHQRDGRTLVTGVVPGNSPQANEAAMLMKSFPGMCPVQIRRDNIQAAREYIQQNRMITVTIVAISPEMVGNMGPQMDKVGHPMAPGNVPGFQLLLQGLFSLSALAFTRLENGRGAVFLPDDNRRTLTCVLFNRSNVPDRFGQAPPGPPQPAQPQGQLNQAALAAAAASNPGLVQAFIQRQQQQAAAAAAQAQAQAAQQQQKLGQPGQPQGILPPGVAGTGGPVSMGFGGPAGGTTVGFGGPPGQQGAPFNPQMFLNNPVTPALTGAGTNVGSQPGQDVFNFNWR